jgi:hypothetical protein
LKFMEDLEVFRREALGEPFKSQSVERRSFWLGDRHRGLKVNQVSQNLTKMSRKEF